MKYYAVLDTNVLVSALLGKKSAPVQVLDEEMVEIIESGTEKQSGR